MILIIARAPLIAFPDSVGAKTNPAKSGKIEDVASIENKRGAACHPGKNLLEIEFRKFIPLGENRQGMWQIRQLLPLTRRKQSGGDFPGQCQRLHSLFQQRKPEDRRPLPSPAPRANPGLLQSQRIHGYRWYLF